MSGWLKDVFAHAFLLLGLSFMIMATVEFGGQPIFIVYFLPSGLCFLVGLKLFIECIVEGIK